MAWTNPARSRRFGFLAAKVSLSSREEGSFDPGDILPGPCVHGDFDPFFIKGGTRRVYPVSRVTGLLSPARNPLGPWVRTGDQEIDKVGQGQADGPSVKKKDVHFKVVDEVVLGIPTCSADRAD